MEFISAVSLTESENMNTTIYFRKYKRTAIQVFCKYYPNDFWKFIGMQSNITKQTYWKIISSQGIVQMICEVTFLATFGNILDCVLKNDTGFPYQFIYSAISSLFSLHIEKLNV